MRTQWEQSENQVKTKWEQIEEQIENEAKTQREQSETKWDMNFMYCEFLPPPTSYPALAGFMDRGYRRHKGMYRDTWDYYTYIYAYNINTDKAS